MEHATELILQETVQGPHLAHVLRMSPEAHPNPTAESTKKPAPSRTPGIMGDVWGGLAATLVALPASVAFGVAVYGPIGGAGAGALAGLLGATALGTIAPIFGGTPRLVSAPCAPAVAVMSAFALQMVAKYPGQPGRALIMMTLVGLVSAALQLLLGVVRAGTIIKYIPYPVVTGYLSGVGVVIFLKQVPALLGLAKGVSLGHGVVTPATWQWPALVIGATTMAVMLLAPRLTKAVPPAVLGLGAGVAAFGLLTLAKPELRTLAGNALVVGPLSSGGPSFLDAFRTRISSLSGLHLADATDVFSPALTLAVLLSLDTLKTCVVVDALTGARHESNRELVGQGLANTMSALIGGMPGAGTSGPTLVNIASGGQTKKSAVIEGVMVLFAFLLLGRVVAWAPLAALAGILAVVAFRMFDFGAMGWVKRKATVFDFAVVAAVIFVAVFIDLIAASATGVALSILIFIRNEARGAVIRRKLPGSKVLSKQRRLPEQMEILTRYGGETVVVELQGSLFFGTTDQLRNELAKELDDARTIIFDMRRVDAVDMTAVHILEQMHATLHKRGADMMFCNVPRSFAGRSDAVDYLKEVGLLSPKDDHELFEQLSDALAWTEERILEEHGARTRTEDAVELLAMPMFVGRKAETLGDLAECVQKRALHTGEHVFHAGDEGDEIHFVRTGSVRISLTVGDKHVHVASFGRGDFFGEITFLDGGQRTADAVAESETELFVISRKRFDTVAAAHPRLAQALFSALARNLALRLRQADREISTLEEA
jgi:SulP family sulfate permease